jgi:hypothetical protein
MMHTDRQRRGRSPILEGMESRNLLSGGLASQLAAEVHVLRLKIPPIQGTIRGTVAGITPISASTEVVTFSAQGKANIIGDGRGSGQFTIASKAVKHHPTNDTYSNGSATVTGTTDTVAIRYTGTGHTNANGSFTATLHGTAKSVAGQHSGLSGSFTAQLSGNSRTGPFAISFTIKV